MNNKGNISKEFNESLQCNTTSTKRLSRCKSLFNGEKKSIRVLNFYGNRLTDLTDKRGYKEYLKSNLFYIKGNNTNDLFTKKQSLNKIPYDNFNKTCNEINFNTEKHPDSAYQTTSLGFKNRDQSLQNDFRISSTTPKRKLLNSDSERHKNLSYYYSKTNLVTIPNDGFTKNNPTTNNKNVVKIDNIKIDEDNFIQKLKRNPMYKRLDKATLVEKELQAKSKKILTNAIKVRNKYFKIEDDGYINEDFDILNIVSEQKNISRKNK